METPLLEFAPTYANHATMRFHHPMGDTHTIDRVIFACRFGSRLHGTATETSDLDVKAVYVADVNDILLGSYTPSVHVGTGVDALKNTPEDVDIEFIEIRKFVSDTLKGQTYAIEMLFCDAANTLYASPLWDELQGSRARLITKNIKPFTGYCVAQAKKYGLKGSRLKATEDVLEFIAGLDPKQDVASIVDSIPKNEYVFTVEKYFSHQQMPGTLLEINGKQFNMTNHLGEVSSVLTNLVHKYGARSHRAKDGMDYKALSHAYRCLFELKELVTTGSITFPLKDREFLRDVKLGNVPHEQVQEELPALLEEMEALDSVLPDEPDHDFSAPFLLRAYRKCCTF